MNTKVKEQEKETVYIRCNVCGDVLKFQIEKKDKQYVSDVAAGFGWSYCKGRYTCKSCEEECL